MDGRLSFLVYCAIKFLNIILKLKTFSLKDYYSENITLYFDTDAVQKMADIIDPYGNLIY